MPIDKDIGICSELDYILDAIHDDILISDGQGVILRLSRSFETMYVVNRDEIIGRTVFEMEEKGIFKPSITAIVLKTGNKTTMRQKNNIGRDIVVTAVPIKDDQGCITHVVSFSRDVTELLALQQQYHELEIKFEKYSAEVSELRERIHGSEEIVAESELMKKTIQLASKVAKYDAHVLITGESGAGKTMIARFIHENSSRNDESFVEINCGAIPDNLIESELFGYEEGAFTGAKKRGKMGLIEIADKGTLFLDEISELPVSLQVKLLKVLQDKTFVRVGGVTPIHSDFRLITASNKNLKTEVDERRFREDLFYRINVVSIFVPPLRSREEDIIELIRRSMARFNEKYGEHKRISPKAYQLLLNYDWPGNVRELENTIERIIITAEGDEIGIETLPSNIAYTSTSGAIGSHGRHLLSDAVKQLEKEQILKAFAKHKTSAGVARELGISQATAYRKIREYIR